MSEDTEQAAPKSQIEKDVAAVADEVSATLDKMADAMRRQKTFLDAGDTASADAVLRQLIEGHKTLSTLNVALRLTLRPDGETKMPADDGGLDAQKPNA